MSDLLAGAACLCLFASLPVEILRGLYIMSLPLFVFSSESTEGQKCIYVAPSFAVEQSSSADIGPFSAPARMMCSSVSLC